MEKLDSDVAKAIRELVVDLNTHLKIAQEKGLTISIKTKGGTSASEISAETIEIEVSRVFLL